MNRRGLDAGGSSAPVLEVERLNVVLDQGGRAVTIVDGVGFDVRRGEVVGLLGESGCGKTMTALALMRLLPRYGVRNVSGRVSLGGLDVLALDPAEMRRIRGKKVAMVFQEPMTALNPTTPIGAQITEAILLHEAVDRGRARARAEELLDMVGIPDPRRRMGSYPHEMSGGMLQRAMIAMAISCGPDLLIADEPTTALDVTIQAQVLGVLKRMREELGLSMLLVTHDMGVVADMADRTVVMYAGKVVESGPTDEIFRRQLHPYTEGLLASIPRMDQPRGGRLDPISGTVPPPTDWPAGCRFHPRCRHASARCSHEAPPLAPPSAGRLTACWHWDRITPRAASAPVEDAAGEERHTAALVTVTDIGKHFPAGRRPTPFRPRPTLRAVDGVSFAVNAGETLAVVGESGSGKTTLGKLILGLLRPSHGTVAFKGKDVRRLRGRALREFRRSVQVIFQDPLGSLDPRMTAGAIIEEPLIIHRLSPDGRSRSRRVDELMRMVGLPTEYRGRYPHQFSGGQRQRIGIARALAFEPELIVCDEPVSALDVSIRAQIVQLLSRLQGELGIGYLFVAHDLSLVRHIAHRVAVFYRGQMVELADAHELFDNPQHPYTEALIDAIPVPDPAVQRNRARASDPPTRPGAGPVVGCPYTDRCPLATEVCRVERPRTRELRAGHSVACHHTPRPSRSARVAGNQIRCE